MPVDVGLNWTPFALRQLDEIYDFVAIEQNSPEIAMKLINSIFDRTDQLKAFQSQAHPNHF